MHDWQQRGPRAARRRCDSKPEREADIVDEIVAAPRRALPRVRSSAAHRRTRRRAWRSPSSARGNVLAQHIAALRAGACAGRRHGGRRRRDTCSRDLWQDLRYAARVVRQAARLRGHRRADARARHRRDHGDLQLGLRRAAEAAAVRRAASARERCANTRRTARAANQGPAHVSHVSRESTGVRGHRRVGRDRGVDHRRRRTRNASRRCS